MNDFHDVGDFHTKFGLPSVVDEGVYPRHPTRELLEFRLNFLLEEFLEIVKGAGAQLWVVESMDKPREFKVKLPDDQHWDHAQVFDGLIDLVYVSLGLAHIEGYPWREGWDRVQNANMSKERATEETASARGGTWDVVKPPGWTPPDIEGLLRDHGWGIPK
jgi:predicted HAD superfamily Cof-like phosphohydrolase